MLAITALAIAFGVLDPLQTAVPGYTSALENHIEGSKSISKQLQSLSGEHANTLVPPEAAAGLTGQAKARRRCPFTADDAPDFTGIVAWLNTPGDMPLTLAELKGKIVLVDFWTYSCINCQRSLPHVEAWYKDYKADGLVVVGVHTPEFAFEHVVSNVSSAAASLGVDYPVARRRQLRDLERLRQPVLAGRVPDRPDRRGAGLRLRRGPLRRRRRPTSASC